MSVLRELVLSHVVSNFPEKCPEPNQSIQCNVCNESCMLQCLILPCGHFVHNTSECIDQLEEYSSCTECQLDVSEFIATHDVNRKISISASIKNIMAFMDTCNSTLTSNFPVFDGSSKNPSDLLSQIVLHPPQFFAASPPPTQSTSQFFAAPTPPPSPPESTRFFATRQPSQAMICAQKHAMNKREKDFRRLFATTVELVETKEQSRDDVDSHDRIRAAVLKARADDQMRAAATMDKAKSKAEAKAKAESEAKAKANSKAKAEAKAKAKAEAKAKAKSTADAKAGAESEAKAKAESEARARAKAKSKLKNRDNDDDDEIYKHKAANFLKSVGFSR